MVFLNKGTGDTDYVEEEKSRVLVAGICISTLLSPVAFEASKGYAALWKRLKVESWKEQRESFGAEDVLCAWKR